MPSEGSLEIRSDLQADIRALGGLTGDQERRLEAVLAVVPQLIEDCF